MTWPSCLVRLENRILIIVVQLDSVRTIELDLSLSVWPHLQQHRPLSGLEPRTTRAGGGWPAPRRIHLAD